VCVLMLRWRGRRPYASSPHQFKFRVFTAQAVAKTLVRVVDVRDDDAEEPTVLVVEDLAG